MSPIATTYKPGDVLRYPDGERGTVVEVNWHAVKLELASGGFAFVALDDIESAGIVVLREVTR